MVREVRTPSIRENMRKLLSDGRWHYIADLVYSEPGKNITPEAAMHRLQTNDYSPDLSHSDLYIQTGRRIIILDSIRKSKEFEIRGEGWAMQVRWKGKQQ